LPQSGLAQARTWPPWRESVGEPQAPQNRWFRCQKAKPRVWASKDASPASRIGAAEQRRQHLFVVLRQIGAEVGGIAVEAEKDHLRGDLQHSAGMAATDEDGLGAVAVAHQQVAVAPYRHDAGRAVVQALGQPVLVLAPVRGAVERIGGVMQMSVHDVPVLCFEETGTERRAGQWPGLLEHI